MFQRRCMIVEDQALIGMSLEASLEDAGFMTAGPFMTSAEALRWLQREEPDVAVLDIMLKDGTSVDVASVLKARGIPFAVYSGLPPTSECPPELQGVPWLEKPARRETLARVLTGLVEGRQEGKAPFGGHLTGDGSGPLSTLADL